MSQVFVLCKTVLSDKISSLVPPLQFSQEAPVRKHADKVEEQKKSGKTEEQVKSGATVRERMNSGMELSLLIMGRPGTGKSTLLSGLLGKELDRVVLEGFDASSVSGSTVQIDGLTVTTVFWNSPGVHDGGLNMEGLLSSIDLVIYTVRMDDTRMRPGDIENLQKLTQQFGSSLWEKGLFVLTFGNRVSYLDDQQAMRRSQEYLAKRAGQWMERFQEVLINEGLARGLVRSIPFVPAGHPAEPRLFPGEEPWRGRLLESISARVNGDARIAVKSL